jgi:hypothetical protein
MGKMIHEELSGSIIGIAMEVLKGSMKFSTNARW